MDPPGCMVANPELELSAIPVPSALVSIVLNSMQLLGELEVSESDSVRIHVFPDKLCPCSHILCRISVILVFLAELCTIVVLKWTMF